MDDTIGLMRQRLVVLEPVDLSIEDESAAHAGHAGARSGGGHYRLLIVSRHFTGLNSVDRHRSIYSALGDLMRTRVHALAITALTPEEL